MTPSNVISIPRQVLHQQVGTRLRQLIVEGQAGELAAQRITDEELAELRALHYEMLAAFTRRDLPTYYRFNALIHNGISAAARNPVLAQTYRTVNARLQAVRLRSNMAEGKWAEAVKEHEEMIELLAKRDALGMRALLVAHIEHKRDAILDLMRQGRLDTSLGEAAT